MRSPRTRAARLCFAAISAVAAIAGCGLRLSPGEPAPGPVPDRACATAEECPKADVCYAMACVAGSCRPEVVAAGTVPDAQPKGDCKELFCDGRGNALSREDRADVPVDDHNECTDEACDGDDPKQSSVAAGAACGQGGVCNGAGVCGVCVPGKRRCAAGLPEGCDPSGQWAKGAACGGATPVCGSGACAGVTDLSVGARHACARLSTGGARCWGANGSAQIGSDEGRRRRVPIAGVVEIALGLRHGCARLDDATLACWGANDLGELGDGTRDTRPGPVAVIGVKDAAQVAAGDAHTCARTKDGAVWCWGANGSGQIGDGSTAPVPKGATRAIPPPGPTAGADLAGAFAQIAAGGAHTCAILPGGAAECWGDDSAGQLGGTAMFARETAPPPPHGRPHAAPHRPPRPGPATRPKPARPLIAAAKPRVVRGIRGAIEIALAGDHGCARTKDGAVMCWGDNDKGQLGDGSATARPSPVRVAGLAGATAIAVGRRHGCAIAGGAVMCWGDGEKGQLGDGAKTGRKAPAPVPGLTGATAIAAGGDRTCARLASGAVTCWGEDAAGAVQAGPTPIAW